MGLSRASFGFDEGLFEGGRALAQAACSRVTWLRLEYT